MAKILILTLLSFLMSLNSIYSQKIYQDSMKTASGIKYRWEIISYTKYNIGNAFVFVVKDSLEFKNKQSEIKACTVFRNNNSHIFLTIIPKLQSYTENDKTDYVEIINYILSRQKMIDSRLFLVDNGGITETYKKLEEKGKVKMTEKIISIQLTDNFCHTIDMTLKRK